MATDLISRNIYEIKKIDTTSSCMLKCGAMSYHDDDLIPMQLNDLVVEHALNILYNTGDDCCPFSWFTELKRYRNKILLKASILKYNHHSKYLTNITGELRENILGYGFSEKFSGHSKVFRAFLAA